MGKVFDRIDSALAAWLQAQPMFFVATAPCAPDGLINVSPKGLDDTFAILDEHRIAYLDLTGSGIETVAHLRDDGRIVVMFPQWTARQSEQGIADYRAAKNRTSVDGLPGLAPG